MRDRLIELLRKARTKDVYTTSDGKPVTTIDRSIVDFEEVSILADYLITNGVIVLPCNVGDTVYRNVNDKRVKNPCEFKVVGVWYSRDKNCNCAHIARFKNGLFDRSLAVEFTDFGKTVFLTKEEAEAKLKGGVQK